MNKYILVILSALICFCTLESNAQVFKKIQSDGDGAPSCPFWSGVLDISQYVVFTNLQFGEGEGCQPIVNAPCNLSLGIFVPALNQMVYHELTSCDFREPIVINGELVYEGYVSMTFDLSHLDLCSEANEGRIYVNYEVDLYCSNGGVYEPVNFCNKHLIPTSSPWDEIISPNVFDDIECSQHARKGRCFKCFQEVPPNDDKPGDKHEDDVAQFGKNRIIEYDQIESKVIIQPKGIILQNTKGNDSPISVKVYNISGQIINQAEIDYYNPNKKNNVHFNDLEKGFYIIMTEQDNKIITTKAIVQ